MEIKNRITAINQDFKEKLSAVKNFDQLESLRLEFLSRSGVVSLLMAELKNYSSEEKRELGVIFNNLKNSIQSDFDTKKADMESSKSGLSDIKFDVSSYMPNQVHGHLHPYTHVENLVENVFISMGYQVVEGPELEDDFHNFEALNIPKDHPARDMQDTFWLNLPGKLMRTQTSTVQIRYMENNKPPIAILSMGRVYRNEATDASHDFVFKQIEGLFVAKDVSMGNLFATIKACLEAIFGKETLQIRVRPSFFPFVEPGVEIDMECPFCLKGCSVCKYGRWIEIMGAGLVHPNVLRACGIDPKVYSGFAFGMGLTRLVMLKYGINDIRLLSSSKIEFLRQFA